MLEINSSFYPAEVGIVKLKIDSEEISQKSAQWDRVVKYEKKYIKSKEIRSEPINTSLIGVMTEEIRVVRTYFGEWWLKIDQNQKNMQIKIQIKAS